MEAKKESIGDRIAALRKRSGLTQSQLAEKLNLTDKAVSKWESGGGEPNIEALADLAKVLGTTTDYLLTGKVPEEKIVLMSKIELCAKKDDPELLKQIKNDPVTFKDEKGKSLLDYVFQYESTKVFLYLIRIVSSRKPNAFYVYDKQASWCGKPISEVIYLSLIGNCVSQLCLINPRLDIGTMPAYFYDDKTIKAVLTDKRISQETKTLIFSSHNIPFNYSSGQVPNWQTVYPIFFEEAVNLGLKDEAEKIYQVFEECDSPIIDQKNRWNNEKGHGYDEKFHILLMPRNLRFYEVSGPKVLAVAFSKNSLQGLLDNKWFDLTKKASAINKEIGAPYISDHDFKFAQMKSDKLSNPDNVFIFGCIEDGILNLDKLKESDNPELVKRALDEQPIEYQGLLRKWVKGKDYKSLFEFALDKGFISLARAIANKETNIDSEIEALLSNRSSDGIKLRKMGAEFNRQYWNNPQHLIYSEKDYNETINKIKEKVLEGVIAKSEKSKAIEELDDTYFENLFSKGDLDMATVKECVKLEALLRPKYPGVDLASLIDSFINGLKDYDDGDDEGWGGSFSPLETKLSKLFTKLRRSRNSIVHPEGNAKEKMTEEELRECLSEINKLAKA